MTMNDRPATMVGSRSKTMATWLAVVGGVLGAHRFYLHGKADPWAWLHVVGTVIGWSGVARMRRLGQDDQLAWVLAPVLGVVVTAAMLAALVIGLMPDEKWTTRFNPGLPVKPSGWPVVLGVIAALSLGSTALMSTLAFSGQKFFEYRSLQRPTRKRPQLPPGAPRPPCWCLRS